MIYTQAPSNMQHALDLLSLSVLSGLSTEWQTQKPVSEICTCTGPELLRLY